MVCTLQVNCIETGHTHKCSKSSKINCNCNDVQIEPEVQRSYLRKVQIPRMVQDWMSLPVVYGEADVRGQWWMSAFPLLQIATSDNCYTKYECMLSEKIYAYGRQGKRR